MKNLIEKEDFLQAANLKKYKIRIAANTLMNITGIKKLNKIYEQISSAEGIEFIDKLIDELSIKFLFDEKELKAIPKEGPFLIVANHPFGFLDSLIMIKVVSYIRNDFKIFTNEILKNFLPVQEYLLAQNESELPFQYQEGIANDFLDKNYGIGIFPSENSSYIKTGSNSEKWELPRISFIKNATVPIIPICFMANTKLVNFLLGLLKPNISNNNLPVEISKNKPKQIALRIGSQLTPREQNEFKTVSKFGRFLQAKTYSLGSAIDVSHFFKHDINNLPNKPQPLAIEVDKNLIIGEIQALRDTSLINEQQNYELFIATADQIPNALQEIGRLREITFRAVGEGTNKPFDIDEYDLYYYHLFLWDNIENQIVGAYRIGKGGEIMRKYGKRGFYTNSLFKSNEEFNPYLEKCIELGRSFIIPDYQNKRLPLFMLWRGILYFLIKNPDYRYVLGPVSISNNYSNLSKSLIVAFIREHYFDHKLASYIQPKKKYHINLKDLDYENLMESSKDDLKKFDKILYDIEPSKYTLPILLKKYIRQNAKIIGFNIDPKFSDALDGLMILDMKDVPAETIENLKKDFMQNDE